MTCNHIPTCELYSQFKLQGSLRLWKLHYCESERYMECARYQRTTQGLPVPVTLLPNGKTLGGVD